MTTPQHAIDAANEINAALSRTHYVNIAAIIARHPDPELARLREENERLRFPHPRLHETQKQLLDVIAERDQLRARVAELEKRILDDNKAFGYELHDPNGTIWEHADKLQKENAELRQSLENHARANDKLVVEVAELRRDRERLEHLIETEKFVRSVYVHGFGTRHYLSSLDDDAIHRTFDTPRDAIDAARAKDAKTEGGV